MAIVGSLIFRDPLAKAKRELLIQTYKPDLKFKFLAARSEPLAENRRSTKEEGNGSQGSIATLKQEKGLLP